MKELAKTQNTKVVEDKLTFWNRQEI